jgi:hypothetical protein
MSPGIWYVRKLGVRPTVTRARDLLLRARFVVGLRRSAARVRPGDMRYSRAAPVGRVIQLFDGARADVRHLGPSAEFHGVPTISTGRPALSDTATLVYGRARGLLRGAAARPAVRNGSFSGRPLLPRWCWSGLTGAGRLGRQPVQVGWRRCSGATGPVSGAYGRPVEVTEERGNEV